MAFIPLQSGSQPGPILPAPPSRGHLAVSGDIFGCRLETFLVVMTGRGGGATDIWWVEARDAAAKHPVMHRSPSPLTPQQRIMWPKNP